MKTTITAIFLVTLCLRASYAQTPSPLPAPTGSYAVGRTIFNWVDESRVDLLNPKGFREIPVWVWYPATPANDAPKAEWLPGVWGEIFAALIAPPSIPGQSAPARFPVNTLRSHAYDDAPLAATQKRYPVVLFAPGYGSNPIEYAGLIEDLVSQGYIVAGMVPTYFSSYTVFLDGRVVGQYQPARSVPGAPASSWDRTPVPETVYRLWAGDIRFTLNELEKLNADSKGQWKGRIDPARIGLLGHSMGGTVAAQAAHDDGRLRATILLDSTLMGEVARKPVLPQPLLLIQASSFKGRQRPAGIKGRTEIMNTLLRNTNPSYVLTIAGTTHSSFADVQLMPFAQDWPDRGTNPTRAMVVTRAYIKAFFDQHLLGKTASLLDGPSSDYPEATLEHTFVKP